MVITAVEANVSADTVSAVEPDILTAVANFGATFFVAQRD